MTTTDRDCAEPYRRARLGRGRGVVGLELVAVARFHVAADGSAQVELTEATPKPSFNQALLAALKKWRFFPAMESGKPVASDVDVRIPLSVK